MKKKFGILVIAILVIIDQLTKYLAIQNLKDQAPIIIIKDVFQLFYLENRGAAFGILQNKEWFLTIVPALILAAIFYIVYKLPDEKKYIPLYYICLFISAGAIGNLIDRVRYSFVVDFFYFELIDFPVFNIADSYVSVAAIILVLLGFFYYKDEDFEFLKSKNKKMSSKEEE